MDVFFKLAWFFKAQKKYYILGLIMLLFIALLELLPPQIIGKTIDGITKKTLTPQLLTIYLIILAVAAVLIYISRYIWRISIFGTSQKLGNILRRYLYHKYTEMSAQFFQKKTYGRLNGSCDK